MKIFFRLFSVVSKRKIKIFIIIVAIILASINCTAQTNHFFIPQYGGDTYPIVIQRVYLNNSLIDINDEIAIIDTSLNIFNGIVGLNNFDGSFPISSFAYMKTIIGKDTLPGANAGGKIMFLAWDNSEEREYQCKAYFQTGGFFGDGFATNIDSLICEGITEVNSKKKGTPDDKFQFYPNPFSNVINISGLYSHISSIEMINILGQSIYKRNVENSSQPITISGLFPLPQGVYFLRIKTSTLNNFSFYKTIKIFHTK